MGYLFEIFLQHTDSEKWKKETWENMCKECEQTKKTKKNRLRYYYQIKLNSKQKLLNGKYYGHNEIQE